MFQFLFSPESLIALTTLTMLEIVLGIDNIIFISILVNKLPLHQRARGRLFGMSGAMLTRIVLLLSLAWVMKLTTPLFSFLQQDISGRDLILIFGGLFLIGKSTHEIHSSMEGEQSQKEHSKKGAGFVSTLIQISILDIVFSLDSVITAVGMVSQVQIMILAIVIAVLIMLFAAKSIGDFVDNNPTLKILALSFLNMVGLALIAEGFDVHVPKGYIYTAMAFSLFVEVLNIKMRSGKEKKLTLYKEIE
jgi:Membrane protein TerC, possibly involved in tellurium resistance